MEVDGVDHVGAHHRQQRVTLTGLPVVEFHSVDWTLLALTLLVT
jgi:hypothetical protein